MRHAWLTAFTLPTMTQDTEANPVTLRDHLMVGVATVAFGVVPLGFGIGLAVVPASDGGSMRGALISALLAAPCLLLGAYWISRRVTFFATELRCRTWLGERAIRTEEVTGIRFNLALAGTPAQREASGVRLVVIGARGARIVVGLTSRAQVEAVHAWLVQVADMIEERWRRELDAGRTYELSPRIQLTASSLEHRGKRIDLTQPFTLEEVPGYGAPPLLRVSGTGDGIELEGDFDNYPVLVRHLRRLQRG